MPSERDDPTSKKNEVNSVSQGTPGRDRSAPAKSFEGMADEGDTVIHEEEKTMVHAVAEKPQDTSDAADAIPQDKAYLQIFSGGKPGKIFPLSDSPDQVTVLGRSPDCQIILEDGSVSRFHSEIRRTGNHFAISDLGSSNGTLVDGNLIAQSHVLRSGAEIGVGIYQFFFNDPNFKEDELPSQLPVPYEKQAEPQPVAVASAPVGSAPSRFPTLTLVFVSIFFISALLLFYGVKKIIREDNGSLRTAWTDLFGSNEGPRLAYPLLEIKTEPLSGDIYFQGDLLGRSPLEKKLTDGVQPNADMEIRGEFFLPVVEEKVVVSKIVRFNRDQEIASFLLEAPVAQIHVKKLPNNTTLLLEYTPLEASPSVETKIRQPKIDYKEPFLVPYGNYKLELRLREEFRFRRTFTLDQTNRFMPFEVSDEDLTYAPLSIDSVPAGATIILDGQILEQQTPLKDFRLSMGPHSIVLRKENFKDFFLKDLPSPIQVNEVLQYNVDLPISPVGEKILQAKKEYELGLWKQMEVTLYKSLKLDPQPTAQERAEIQFLLGQSYLKGNDLRQALIYFRKARDYVDAESKRPFDDKGKLGEARVYLAKDEKGKALKSAVEVFFSTNDPTDKAAAEAVFHQVSPIKSVAYIDTIPPGAAIYVNGRKVQTNVDGKMKDALTPLILPDLVDGQYDILLVKPGFQDSKQRLRITVGDLKALRVRLEP